MPSSWHSCRSVSIRALSPLVEIPVWMGDGNLDPFRLQDRQDLFNRWIGRARYLIAHAGFQLSVLLGTGNDSVIDTIVGQHSILDVRVAL